MFSSTISRLPTIGLWAFKILIALAFLTFGAFKLSGAPMMVQEFDKIGLGQWFRYFTGICEVGGAAMVLIPKTWRVGTLVVLGVSFGAFLTQAFVLHGDVVHTVVLIVLTGLMAWLAWKPKPAFQS